MVKPEAGWAMALRWDKVRRGGKKPRGGLTDSKCRMAVESGKSIPTPICPRAVPIIAIQMAAANQYLMLFVFSLVKQPGRRIPNVDRLYVLLYYVVL